MRAALFYADCSMRILKDGVQRIAAKREGREQTVGSRAAFSRLALTVFLVVWLKAVRYA